jgi:DnaJ-domain-containing protein 1
MPNDISASGWLVILCALGLGFGLVRFIVVAMNARLEREAKQTSASKKDESDADRASKRRHTEPPPDRPRPEERAHWTDVLGLTSHAPVADIRTAYKRKMAQYHPDKVATLGPELRALADLMAKNINRAYDEALLESRGPETK